MKCLHSSLSRRLYRKSSILTGVTIFCDHAKYSWKRGISSLEGRSIKERRDILRSTPPSDDIARFFPRTESQSESTSIQAIQNKDKAKVALKDRFQRQHTYLRISLTEKCNLRCQYCMPLDGVPLSPASELLTDNEIIELVNLFAQCGVKKIRLTGGEPLIRKDIVQLVQRIGAIPGIDTIGITTNGVKLSKLATSLTEVGCSQINLSLDTLDPNKFTKISQRPVQYHTRIMQAMDDYLAVIHGRAHHTLKINTVMMKGVNDDELLNFVRLTENKPIHVRFIEFMPFDSNRWGEPSFLSYKDQLSQILAQYPNLQRLEDSPHSTSKTWQVPGFQGTIGFITSMSNHFCGGCNRLRLTADGYLKTCLFGTDEYNLRDPLRQGETGDELMNRLAIALNKKNFALGGFKDRFAIADASSNESSDSQDIETDENMAVRQKNRPMITIGG